MKKGAIVFGLVFILNIFLSNTAAAAALVIKYCKDNNGVVRKITSGVCGSGSTQVNETAYTSYLASTATPVSTTQAAPAAPPAAAAVQPVAPAATTTTTTTTTPQSSPVPGDCGSDRDGNRKGTCMIERAWYQSACEDGYSSTSAGVACGSGKVCCLADGAQGMVCGNARGNCAPSSWGMCPGNGSRVFIGEGDCVSGEVCCEYPDITTVDNRGGATTGSTTGGAAPVMRGVEIPTDTGLSDKSIKQILTGLLQWLLSAVGIIALIGFAISGIQYILAAGDDDMMKAGKKNMVSSIMGIAIVLASLVIIQAIDFALRGMTF